MSTEAMKLALEALEPVSTFGRVGSRDVDTAKAQEAITALDEALAQPQQEPVAFLANGTRFKISYDSRQSGGQIHGIPPELGGRWVAFVAADDDCHLKLTSPPARKPLTDEEIETVWRSVQANDFHDCVKPFARAIEAAHNIKENT